MIEFKQGVQNRAVFCTLANINFYLYPLFQKIIDP